MSIAAAPAAPVSRPRAMFGRLRVAASAVVAAILGVAPHVLHHAGPLAGAALFAGATGSLLFGALGLVAAVPMLRRVRRRTGSWQVPAGLLALFAAVFALSTFVVGPALTGSTSGDASSPASTPSSHTEHHR